MPAPGGRLAERTASASRDTCAMRPRLTSSHFVGRIGELAELELAWRDAGEGRPVLVLLAGDSGIGKTRIVSELEQRLRDDDALVLHGEAVEQGETELPYAPLVSALRSLVRERDPALGALSPGSRAQLATLLPGLGDQPPAVDANDGSGQLRLFEALLELLDLLSERGPVLLVLEDMHWADRSTRTFVSFAVRSLRRERVMLLLSYRADELHRRHPLRSLLSELERLDRVRRIDLNPFDRAEMAEALTDILGGPPESALLDRLYLRSEGNPLFTEELLAAGLDGRASAPESLRDAFLSRTERLSAEAQRAARVIAVGRRLDEGTIAKVTGIEGPQLAEALREAIAEQVIVAGSDGQMGFRHALLREVLYDDLLPYERGEIHLVLARFLEEQPAAAGEREVERTATIASHYAAAGQQPEALRASISAALSAQEVSAYGEAADLAERALELWPRVPDPEQVAGQDHVSLLLLAAGGHSIGADRARAEVLLRAALAEVDPAREPRRYSVVLARLARVQWTLNRGAEGVETARRALEMLPTEDCGPERASLLAWLARTRVLRGRFRDAVADGEAALAVAEEAGDRATQGEVLNTLGMAQIALGCEEEGVAQLRAAMEIARERHDADGLIYAYSNLADLLNLRGCTADALAIAREGSALAPRGLGRGHEWMTLTVSELALETGDWGLARSELHSVRSRPVGVLLIFRLVREADLALSEGDDVRAAASLDELEPLVASSSEPQWIGLLGSLLGELRRRGGDLIGARAAVADALDRLELCTDDVMRIARVTATGARVEADIAQRARDLRETAEERDAVARARIHMSRLRAAAQDGGPVELAWQKSGAAELARARGKPSARLWLAAAAEWDTLERPYPAAIARWRAAEAQVDEGEREAAASLVAGALAVAQNLGSGWLAHELSTLGERARLRLDAPGAGDAPAEPPRASGDPFGLTARERQVLALIAEGATNRQIGAALYMAEKTASVHVSRILRKLDVGSRTQAAAVAHRMGLD